MKLIKGNRKEYLATHPKEAAVEKSTLNQICKRIGTFRKDVEKWGGLTVKLAKDARTIGIFIREAADALPGKQFTLDFFLQYQDVFVDQYGQKITLEQLKLFLRLADAMPEEITDIVKAMSWRQQYLAAAGFELIGEAPGTTAHPVDYFHKFIDLLDVKRVDNLLNGLVNDPNFGEIESWPAERREMVWVQIKPTIDRLNELAGKFKV